MPPTQWQSVKLLKKLLYSSRITGLPCMLYPVNCILRAKRKKKLNVMTTAIYARLGVWLSLSWMFLNMQHDKTMLVHSQLVETTLRRIKGSLEWYSRMITFGDTIAFARFRATRYSWQNAKSAGHSGRTALVRRGWRIWCQVTQNLAKVIVWECGPSNDKQRLNNASQPHRWLRTNLWNQPQSFLQNG